MKKIKLLLTIILILCISLLASCVSKITDKQMKNLYAESVTEIHIESKVHGVQPGRLNTITVITDKNAIARLVAEWKKVNIIFSPFNPIVAGGGSTVTTFYKSDGSTYTIVVSNSIYKSNYKIKEIPRAQEGEVSEIRYSFVIYKKSCETYDYATGQMLGYCNCVSDFKFVKCDPVDSEPLYYISTSFGDLKIYNERIFSKPQDLDTNAFFKLTTEYDFFEVIANLTEEET